MLPTHQFGKCARSNDAEKLARLSRSVDRVVSAARWIMMLGAVEQADGFGGNSIVDTER